jgi:hypothetical protein
MGVKGWGSGGAIAVSGASGVNCMASKKWVNGIYQAPIANASSEWI